MTADIMVDLETLDTRPTGIILSIGACRVNWLTGEIDDHFYRVISVESCVKAGLTESSATRSWWDKQSEEARKVFTDPNVPLAVALAEFRGYLQKYNLNKVRLWGNGSDFDNVLLANAYEALNSNAPWRFYNNRCFRTVRKCFAHLIQEPEREGTHHNALDDAIFQATILLQLKRHLGHVDQAG